MRSVSDHRGGWMFRIGAIGWILALVGTIEVSAGELGIAYRAPDFDRAAVAATLDGFGFDPSPAATFRDGRGIELLVAIPRDPAASARLFDAADAVHRSGGVVGSGEVVVRNADRRVLYAGRVLVELAPSARSADLEPWCLTYGIEFPPLETSDRHVLFRAPLSMTELTMAVRDLPAAAEGLDLVDFDLSRNAPTEGNFDPGNFHRIPRSRNVLAVVYGPNANIVTLEGIAATHSGFTPLPEVRGVHFYEFEDDDAMNAALADLAGDPGVVFLGPAVTIDPPRFLTERLIVKFVSTQARLDADLLLSFHELEYVRRLPFLEHGHVYRRDLPSYALYDAGDALMSAGYASFAQPDTIIEARNACEPADCDLGNRAYLDEIRAPGAWSFDDRYPVSSAIAVVGKNGLISATSSSGCSELSVVALLDGSVEVSSTEREVCIADDPSNWCTDCSGTTFGTDTHLRNVTLLAAARHTPSTGATCDEPRGVSDGPPVLLAQRQAKDSYLDDADLTAETVFSTVLWWLAGGDAGEETFPEPLTGGSPAEVINLSFHLMFRGEEDCEPGSETTCEPICTEDDEFCSTIDETLHNLRDGNGTGLRDRGVVVVAAYPHAGLDSDLARSPETIAAGTSKIDGSPWDVEPTPEHDGDWLQTPGAEIDVVAPMGDDDDTELKESWTSRVGHTSAATAVISAIAARMLDVNPELTADQVHCILRTTADPRNGPADWWNDDAVSEWTFTVSGSIDDCKVDSDCDVATDCSTSGGAGFECRWMDDCGFESNLFAERSPCFGHGLVDACRALETAEACRDSAVVFSPPPSATTGTETAGATAVPGTVGGVERTDTKASYGGLEIATSSACPCTPDGTPVVLEPVLLVGDAPFPLGPDDKVDHPAMVALQCGVLGDCECRLPSECVVLDVVNPHPIDWADVHMQACIRNRCWDVPLPRTAWKAGDRLEVPLPTDRELVSWWIATGERPELRAFSGTRRIELSTDRGGARDSVESKRPE